MNVTLLRIFCRMKSNSFLSPGSGWARPFAILGMIALGAVGAHAANSQPAVQFNRDIRPILGENCLACHGPDTNARKANLRLDTQAGIFEATPKRGPAVVPGNLEKSELFRRIMTPDEDDLMPPPKSHKVLKPEEKELIRQWILAGAPWQGHWSFIKPVKEAVPAVRKAGWVRNPIDNFVLAKLESKGLAPAPEADRRTLARRLSLDLTGLPPAPEDVERFVKDRSRDAYEKYVRKLLSSPRWGEHRGRYWLDAARYADTHGLHFDNYREMWPYRDYVIRSFNQNKAFDKFVVEQLAGDLLANPTDDELVATGFHRCNMTTNEGGTIEEENLTNYANDRVTTTGWVFMGLTMNCSACHDHKFDPITQRDFYGMAAYFRNTTQSGFDKNHREGDLFIVAPQGEADRARWKALPAETAAARAVQAAEAPLADLAFTNWLAEAKPEKRRLEFTREYLALPLQDQAAALKGQLNGKAKLLGNVPLADWRADGPFGPAPVMTTNQSIVLGDLGDLDDNEPLTFAAWIWVPKEFKGEGSILARMAGADQQSRGWDFFLKDDDFGLALIHRGPGIALKVRSFKALTRDEWHHVCVTYDGGLRARGMKLYVDGKETNTQPDQDRLNGTIKNSLPLQLGRRESGNQLHGVALQDVRVIRRRLAPLEINALAAAPRLAKLFTQAPTNAPAMNALRDYHHLTLHRGWQQAYTRVTALETEMDAIRAHSPVAHIQREKTNSEPMAAILFRGEYDKPRDKVGGATPAFLPPRPEGSPNNRLGLAQWVVSPENPLTARAAVNRYWQEIFGTGIVKTTEDFGTVGDPPINQALLDWLAVEFQESGWDVQHIFTLLVTSAAYRQSAVTTPAKLELDPQNRYLSRGPRFRMDGEMIRDFALSASGLLNPAMGGPSVRPYQPPGVWEVVGMPESNTRHYIQDHGPDLYRRSIYTFWKRGAPPASMDILNAPNRETCAVRRERTNTPLQALVPLNDPQFIEASRKLAELALARGRREAINVMSQRLLGRPLSTEEQAIVQRTLKEMEAHFRADPGAANQLLGVGESAIGRKQDLPELAAMTMVANQLMNLDEALNK
jgi:hypothetical protein